MSEKVEKLIAEIEALPTNDYLGQFVSETNSPYCIGANDLKTLAKEYRELKALAIKKGQELSALCDIRDTNYGSGGMRDHASKVLKDALKLQLPDSGLITSVRIGDVETAVDPPVPFKKGDTIYITDDDKVIINVADGTP